METVISSATRQVRIGPDLPIVIIGERINPTGKKRLAEALRAGNLEVVRQEALKQVEAGATVLDVNVGVPGVHEPTVMAQVVEFLQTVVDVPLCLDNPGAEGLAAGLRVYRGKALVNSVTGERERLDGVLPLVKEHGAAVIAMALDDDGIPDDPDQRFAIIARIVERATALGIPLEDIVVDPLTLTVGADDRAALVAIRTAERVRRELGLNQTTGASNVSFGLPSRRLINAHYLAAILAAGVNCPIVDPTVPEVKAAIVTMDLLLGKDEYAMRFLDYYRATDPNAVPV